MKKLYATGVLMASLVAGSAFAQSVTPVLVADFAEVYKNTDAGKSIETQMDAIEKQTKAGLQPELNAINADIEKLRKTPADQVNTPDFQTKQNAIIQRQAKYENNAKKSSYEVNLTYEDALKKYRNVLQTVAKSIVDEKKATLLLNAGDVFYSADSIDVTQAIIVKLNASTKTIPVTKITIPDQPATAPATTAPATNGAPLPKKPGQK